MGKFQASWFLLASLLVLTLLISTNSVAGSGNYRKPPFNGSIFGKRNSEGGGDVSPGGAGSRFPAGSFGSLCEIALETCSSFYLLDSR